MNLGQLGRMVRSALTDYEIESAKQEAYLLIEHVLGLSRSDQIIAEEIIVETAHIDTIMALLNRRLDGEPLDHIFGHREFYGLSFQINKHVLSPRPETEMIVDFVLENTGIDQAFNFLDLGTGSGAIAISILAHRPHAKMVAVDISERALEIAEINAQIHGVLDRAVFKRGNWGASLSASFDFVISNPPYIDDKAMTRLSAEVRNFDPALALSGGIDGLDAYRLIAEQSLGLLKPAGTLVLEIGFDQAKSVSTLLEKKAYKNLTLSQDLSGHDRLITAIAAN